MIDIPLREQHCRSLRGAEHRLAAEQEAQLLAQLAGWEIVDERLVKTFRFSDYKGTMRFVNAVAGLAELENHHPDLEVGYSRVRVSYSTHDVGGLSRNDFICAAKVEALIPI